MECEGFSVGCSGFGNCSLGSGGMYSYGVATISRLLKIIGLLCRVSSH